MRWFIPLVALAVVSGCAGRRVDTTAVSALQIREFQTRTYETNDGNMVTRAVLNALQDEAFIIKTANVDIGLIVAAKEVSVGPSFRESHPFAMGAPDLKDTLTSECSANVSPFGTQTKVRVNCQVKLSKFGMAAEEVRPVDDPQFYRAFCEKVDKSIFIQKEKL